MLDPGMGPYHLSVRWHPAVPPWGNSFLALAPWGPANLRAAIEGWASTTCKAVSTGGISVFVPRVLDCGCVEEFLIRGWGPPFRPRVRRDLVPGKDSRLGLHLFRVTKSPNDTVPFDSSNAKVM